MEQQKAITWRRFLVFCHVCLILLPCIFIFTLGAGMNGEFTTILIIITFLAHIAITIKSGVTGVGL